VSRPRNFRRHMLRHLSAALNHKESHEWAPMSEAAKANQCSQTVTTIRELLTTFQRPSSRSDDVSPGTRDSTQAMTAAHGGSHPILRFVGKGLVWSRQRCLA
jgi:hypothetical protein